MKKSAPMVVIAMSIITMFTILSYHVPYTQYHSAHMVKESNPFVTVAGDKFYLYGNEFVPKIINYYPRDYGWSLMWDNFYSIEDIISEDMARAKALGVNVVRIIVQYSAFGGGNITRVQQNLTKLDDMLSILDRYNMRGLVTLLDWVSPKENLTNQINHVRTIVSAFKDDPRIFAWDIRNEPDHFYYGGWKPYVSKPEIMEYIHQIVDTVRNEDQNHLVTVGEYGWYLGDRSIANTLVVNDDFDDGDYAGWTVISGTWNVQSGTLVGQNGIIRISDNEWWGREGYEIHVRMRTTAPGSEIWNVGRILFRYIDDENYYAVILKEGGNVELAKMQNGTWYPLLANNDTGLDPQEWHDFRIVTFRNETEVYIDGVKRLYFWDENPVNVNGTIYGGLALQAEGGSTVNFDNVSVSLGPAIISDDLFDDVDFVCFHWYEDYDVFVDALSNLRNFTDKPVVVEEIGRPTAGNYSNGDPCPYNETTVASWLSEILRYMNHTEGVYPGVWTLLDFSQEGIPWEDPDNVEHYFGLYRTDYTLKPGGAIYRDEFAGTQLINDASPGMAFYPSSMNCGDEGSVSIQMKNTGSTYWDRAREYRLGSQNPQDNWIWGISRVDIGENITVYPGDTYNFGFRIRAPYVPGKYSFSWKMLREYVEWFGKGYMGTILVHDPSLTTEADDEFLRLGNWSTVQGNAHTSGGDLIVSPYSLVIENDSWGDVSISFRAYAEPGESRNDTLTFVKVIDENMTNYVGFRILENGTVEIFYVLNGSEHEIASRDTNYRVNEYNTYYVKFEGDRMYIYIDGDLVINANISSYPYYNSVGYLGFITKNNTLTVDRAAIYTVNIPELNVDFMLLVAISIQLLMELRKQKRS